MVIVGERGLEDYWWMYKKIIRSALHTISISRPIINWSNVAEVDGLSEAEFQAMPTSDLIQKQMRKLGALNGYS